MRVCIDGMVDRTLDDIKRYEEAAIQARTTGRLDELPDPFRAGAEVQSAEFHRLLLQGSLLRHLRELRDRTEKGDLAALDDFFALYVFSGAPTEYRRQAPSGGAT